MHAHGAGVNVGAYVGYAVGIVGVTLTLLQQLRERRRARPVVITTEVQRRRIAEGPKASVSNDSAVAAFNVRYGVNMGGVHIPWTHSKAAVKASRVNVLPPGQREPAQGGAEIFIPDYALFGIGKGRNPDEGRYYWAYYHGSAGDWWYTENPASRSDDFKVKRLWFGALGWRKRKLDRAMREGEKFLAEALADLRRGAGYDATVANEATYAYLPWYW